MIHVKKEEMSNIGSLFNGIEDSMVIACLQGYMGDAYVDVLPNPSLGLIVSGEYSFFGGDASSEAAKALVTSLSDYIQGKESVAIYPEDALLWRDLLLSIPQNNPKEVMRYGIVQKNYEFDKEKLSGFIQSIPQEYHLKRFDQQMYEQAMSKDWAMEFCETFDSAHHYLARGFGFGILYKDQLVSGASSMTVYDGGIEIQVATDKQFQRKGLALPCAAALLLECMHRNVRPCWDAATLISKHMALKLGYEYKGEYSTVHMHW